MARKHDKATKDGGDGGGGEAVPSKLATLADLHAAPYNPRQIGEKALAGLSYSLAEFGDLAGIVLNARTGQLVAGHQRVKSLRQQYGDLAIDPDTHTIRTPEGHTFAVRIVDWPLSKEKAANVAANASNLQGDFTADLDALVAEITVELPDVASSLMFDELLADVLGADGALDDLTGRVDDMADWGRPEGEEGEGKVYDETAADDVKMCTCPACGHAWPA